MARRGRFVRKRRRLAEACEAFEVAWAGGSFATSIPHDKAGANASAKAAIGMETEALEISTASS